MGFFSKKKQDNPGKPLRSVLKNIGVAGDMIWLHPSEDFNTNSTLIVQPGEEAIFVKNGLVEQVFQSGTYTLETENYPFLSRLLNIFSEGVSSFNCKVYFVRVASSIELTWGTDTPIQVRDPKLGIQTDLRARGSYKVLVSNASVFLTKLIGNGITSFSPQNLKNYFGNEFLSVIKSSIATAVNESDKEILGIASRAGEISKMIEPLLSESLAEYGVELQKFVISGIDFADDELRKRYDEAGIGNINIVREADAVKKSMDIMGEHAWQMQKQYEIMKNVSQQSGDGMAAAGAQLGAGMAIGGAFYGMSNQMMQQQQVQQQAPPPPPAMSQWHILLGGQQVGPVSVQQIMGYVSSGQFKPNDYVWKAGFANWVPAGSVPELAALFGPPAPPAPPVPPTPQQM